MLSKGAVLRTPYSSVRPENEQQLEYGSYPTLFLLMAVRLYSSFMMLRALVGDLRAHHSSSTQVSTFIVVYPPMLGLPPLDGNVRTSLCRY